jgi:aminopeptidase N
MKSIIAVLFFCVSHPVTAQPVSLPPDFRITHYDFSIRVSDNNDSIFGTAILKIKPIGSVKQVLLNLKNINSSGKGMLVQNVMDNVTNKWIPFEHRKDLLTITTNATPYSLTIIYKGIPEDGLIIGKNKFGGRTWFGDNWPNRAQFWLPCIDHPGNKATVNWTVTCPEQYMVTANGVLTAEIRLGNKLKKWVFAENNPIPVKVCVVGIAVLQKTCISGNCVPVCNLYYPETFSSQPQKMDAAIEVVKLFSETIGAYPFQKLNNVQSTTRFGGMENADNIFYDENRVDGSASMEELIAHEIAHQWFGNAVTEKDYAHLWLSEGFATFFSHYYFERKYGTDSVKKIWKEDRGTVKSYLAYSKRPVVDGTSDYMSLLNANSYQKGGLFLQALRKKLGDTLFFNCIRNYFETFKYKNAGTDDFRKIVEETSKKDLGEFFRIWLYTATLPEDY